MFLTEESSFLVFIIILLTLMLCLGCVGLCIKIYTEITKEFTIRRRYENQGKGGGA